MPSSRDLPDPGMEPSPLVSPAQAGGFGTTSASWVSPNQAFEVKVTQSCLTLCNPMDQSMEFSRPDYWHGQPFPSPGDLPNPGIELWSPALWEDSLPTEPSGKPKILERVAYPISSGSSQSRNQIKSNQCRSPALQVDSLPTELSGKPNQHFKCIQSLSCYTKIAI